MERVAKATVPLQLPALSSFTQPPQRIAYITCGEGREMVGDVWLVRQDANSQNLHEHAHRDGERDKVEPTTGFLSFNTPRPSFTAAHDGWRELVLHQLVNSLMYKSDPL